MSSSPCQKTTNSFFKGNNVDFPGAKTQDEARAQANAAEKHAGPHGSGNGRAGRAAELPLHVLHGFQGRRRSGGARRRGNLRRRPEAPTARGRRLTKEEAATAVWERDRAGRTPGFSEAHDAPALSPLCGGDWRDGRAALALRAFLCHAAAVQKRGAKRRRTAARPGTDAPGRSRENLSTKIPA